MAETDDEHSKERSADDESDPGGWRGLLGTAWEWISGVFHGHAGTDQLRNRGP